MWKRIALASALTAVALLLGADTGTSSDSDPAEAAPDGGELLIRYQYDELNRLVRVDYGGGQTVTYDYDPAGNLVYGVAHHP